MYVLYVCISICLSTQWPTPLSSPEVHCDIPPPLVIPASQIVQPIAIAMYTAELEPLRLSILSAAQRARLDAVRAFTGIADDAAHDLNAKAFGPLYQAAVAESMAGEGGVVAPEVREGLTKVADRLGLRPADADRLFARAATERLRAMVGNLVATIEVRLFPVARMRSLCSARRKIGWRGWP
jgi:hypothetical protein